MSPRKPSLTESEIAHIESNLDQLPASEVDDPDNPEWTDEMWARARPPEEVLPPEVLAAFPNTKRRGRPAGSEKEAVSIRLDKAVLDHFRASGPGWQSRINDLLVETVQKRRA